MVNTVKKSQYSKIKICLMTKYNVVFLVFPLGIIIQHSEWKKGQKEADGQK